MQAYVKEILPMLVSAQHPLLPEDRQACLREYLAFHEALLRGEGMWGAVESVMTNLAQG